MSNAKYLTCAAICACCWAIIAMALAIGWFGGIPGGKPNPNPGGKPDILNSFYVPTKSRVV